MTASPRKRRLSPKARGALELLVDYPLGVSGAVMFARCFTPQILASLVRNGLATVERDEVSFDSTIRIKRYHITDAGRKAIEDR